MPVFPVTDVAFTGFRLVRERPRAVAVWVLLQLALSLSLGALAVEMAGPRLASIEALGATSPIDSAKVLALLAGVAPFYAVLFLLSVPIDAVVLAAMSRAVIRPDEDAFGYFRLGRDELRLIGVVLAIMAVVFGAYLGAVVVAGVLDVMAATIAKSAQPLIPALAILVVAVGLPFLLVRLSLAPSYTLATGRIDLGGAWRLTRGRFWPMLGAYVLAGVLGAVVLALGLVVTAALVAVIGGMGALGQIARPDYASLWAFYTPARLAQTAVSAALNALVTPVLLTPAAAIYLRLAPRATPGFGV